jgi:hypothetical protein
MCHASFTLACFSTRLPVCVWPSIYIWNWGRPRLRLCTRVSINQSSSSSQHSLNGAGRNTPALHLPKLATDQRVTTYLHVLDVNCTYCPTPRFWVRTIIYYYCCYYYYHYYHKPVPQALELSACPYHCLLAYIHAFVPIVLRSSDPLSSSLLL